MLNIFIGAPFLALGPALLFLVFYGFLRSRMPLVAAGAWLLYWLYEEGMARRILCSGECNIRVDLLLVYPLLILLSVAAILSGFRREEELSPAPGRPFSTGENGR